MVLVLFSGVPQETFVVVQLDLLLHCYIKFVLWGSWLYQNFSCWGGRYKASPQRVSDIYSFTMQYTVNSKLVAASLFICVEQV